MQKVGIEIYFISLCKSSFPLTDSHKTCEHSIILCGYRMYQNLPRYYEKCREHKKLQLHLQSSATYAEPIFTNFTFDHVDTLHTLFHLSRSRNMESTGRNSFMPSPPCHVFCIQKALKTNRMWGAKYSS